MRINNPRGRDRRVRPHRMRLVVSRRLLVALVAVGVLGCSTPNPNPATPQANMGYVDFFTDSDLGLSWEVKRASQSNGEMETVFSNFKPVDGTVLRLAVTPGNYRFQVWFMNATTEGPQTVEVQVENGKVSPVHITLNPAGTASVDRKVYGFRPSAKGYGHGTKIERDQSVVYRIAAAAEPLQTYRPKEQMSYFSMDSK